MNTKKDNLRLDWNSNKSNDNTYSIIEFIEQNQKVIRNQYFNLIDSFSEKLINNTCLNDCYILKNTYNLWQMSEVMESSFYKSDIYEVIKFIAFDLFVIKYNPKKIILIGARIKTAKLLKEYCSNLELDLKYINHSSNLLMLPRCYLLKGFFYLLRSFLTNSKSYSQKINIKSGKKTIFIVSYLTHLNQNKISKKKFGTALWGDFPDTLYKLGYKINWLHIPAGNYNPDNFFRKLNLKREDKNSTHNFLTSFIEIGSWFSIFMSFIHFSLKNFKFKKVFEFKKTNIFPLFEKAIYNSLKGAALAENLIFVYGFDSIFKKLPKQNLGLYLHENQGWEIGFATAWKNYKHGILTSIQHSTVSFWDLRYKNRFLKINKKYSPDYFGINGNPSYKHFLDFQYPRAKIIKLEALRYLNLTKNLTKNLDKTKNEKLILVLGDVIKKNTEEMLKLILPYTQKNPQYTFYFKSHPAQKIQISNTKYSNFKNIDLPLSQIIGNFYGVICPSSSGAAVESYVLNKKTMVFVNIGELNTSPLKGLKNVHFFSCEKEFQETMNTCKEEIKNSKFFYDNKNYSEWMKFLNKSQEHQK